MRRYFIWVLTHRRLVFLAVGLVTALFAAAASRAVFSSSIPKLFFGDAPEYRAYLERVRAFGNDELVVVGYASDDPLAAGEQARLERTTRALAELPFVASVRSVLDARRAAGVEDGLEIVSYAELARRQPSLQISRELAADPVHRGVLVSEDATAAAVVVELTVDTERSGESSPALIGEILQAFTENGFTRSELHLSGLPVLTAELVQTALDNTVRYFPITGLLLFLSVWLIFHRLSPAWVSIGVSLIAVIWTMGFAALLDRQFSVFTAMVPGVIMVVAFSDIVHLWSAYLLELRAGRTRDEAILESASDVGRACFLTSITTFAGFVSLSFVPTPVFRQLGAVLGFGVAVALLLAMTLVPLFLAMLPAPPVEQREGLPGRILDRLVSGCAWLSTRHPWKVVTAFSLLAVVSGIGASGLHVDTIFDERFRKSNPYRADQDWFAERFASPHTLEIFAEAPLGQALVDGGNFAALRSLHEQIAGLPGVEHVVSVVGVVDSVREAMEAGPETANDPAAVAQSLLLFESSGGTELSRLIDEERHTAHLVARLTHRAVRQTHQTAEVIETLPAGGLDVHATSMWSLLGWWLDSYIQGQKTGFLISLSLIAALMILGLRSLRVGTLSMIPNLLPIVALGGGLAFAYDPLDSDTMLVGMLAVGIAVDDTIHFLSRYRIESARSASDAEAVERTFAFAGRAIIITTVTLTAGFLPFTLSDYYSIWIMGIGIPAVLFIALVADLLLTPALATVGWMHFRRST